MCLIKISHFKYYVLAQGEIYFEIPYISPFLMSHRSVVSFSHRKQIHIICMIWFCCSGRIPRLSLNQHSLYVRVVEKPPPPPLTGEQYGKMEPKYPEGAMIW